MTRPTARVLGLLEVLQSGGTRTAGELAERLGVDERTLRRYVEHLVDLGIPVQAHRGRYGGYRLAPGYRMPPLMLTDDEAVAVLLGLLVADRSALVPSAPDGANAIAKVRRVLPARLRGRLDALLETTDFTAPRAARQAPETEILLAVAQASRAGRSIEIDYRSADGRASRRSVNPRGLVAHAGRWYMTGTDSISGQERTFRLDRVRAVTQLETTFEETIADDAGERLLATLAGVPRRHAVTVLVQSPREHLDRRLPSGLAVVEPAEEAGWWRLRLQVEALDWVPSLLAWIDRPFRIEGPAALGEQVQALADRLLRSVDERLS